MGVGMLDTVLFDLDDTLLLRDRAVRRMFRFLCEYCYPGTEPAKGMESFFLHKDNGGYVEKSDLFDALFLRYPPIRRIPGEQASAFWVEHFPHCYEDAPGTRAYLKRLRKLAKVGLVTNGPDHSQQGKLTHAGLEGLFDVVVTSGSLGIEKPDKAVFHTALDALDSPPGHAIFIGDHLHNDILGSQSAGIRGVWFNPDGRINTTNIRPDAEIRSLEEVFRLLRQ